MTTPIYTYLEKRTHNFFKKAKEVHGDCYDYSIVEYKNNKTDVNIICSEHGAFPQTPANHLSGHGCKHCDTDEKRHTPNSFIKKAIEIHGDRYNYSLVEYIDNKTDVNIICREHGSFHQTPNHHLSGSNCHQCSKGNYSKISIKWLESISSHIQHAENGGEFRITKLDGTYYFVDGYHKETNTVYEFHGDKWHGNSNIFLSEEHCHPFNKDITAKELYDKTIEREEDIKSLGYNLVVMWEHDFKNQLNSL